MCIGHNIHRFDVILLEEECRRLGFKAPDATDFIDTAVIFKGRKLGMRKSPSETNCEYAERVLSVRVKGLRYSLETCVRELGVDVGDGPAHDAAQDAYLTHLAFQALKTLC